MSLTRTLTAFLGALAGLLSGSCGGGGHHPSGTPLLIPIPATGVSSEGTTLGNYTEDLVSQELYRAIDLAPLAVGDRIDGFAFRLDGGIMLPYGDGQSESFSRYDVRIGPAQANLGGTFANNFAGPPTLVRSGALAIPASALTPAPPGPAPFGAPFLFSTPFTYQGGDLLIEVRSTTPSAYLRIDTMVSPQTTGESVFAENDADAVTATTAVFAHNWALMLYVTRP